jgi:copper chaperone
MSDIKFKTNINCGGCVATVTPVLNTVVGENNWEVDTTDREKILTVHTDKDISSEIVAELKKVGYNAVEKQ